MAPLVRAFLENTDVFETRLLVTAQHREMLDQVMSIFNLTPDFDLDLMKPNQNLYNLSAEILLGMKEVLESFDPEYVFVHGDTTTSSLAALAAFYHKAKVCHIEAGLRTNNKWSPYPEEMNRQLTGRLADLHFAPTQGSKKNLLAEGIEEEQIIVTGNTVIDALFQCLEIIKSNPSNEIITLKERVASDKKLILITGHRRENHGQGIQDICTAIKILAERDDVQIVYPVHLNPNILKPVHEILGNCNNVLLIDPLPYESFIWLMNEAHIIITDSGGIQEEAPALGKPVLVMRDTTERPEAVDAGTVILVGTNVDLIVSKTNELMDSVDLYKTMSELHNPYGDGKACGRIIEQMKKLA